MWDDQFSVFAKRYRVIRYDVRGFGKSALPQVLYADWQGLYDLLKALGVEKTYLLGLSLGGRTSIDFTLVHPDMVDALILVGSPVHGFPIELLFDEKELKRQEALGANFVKAKQERNVSGLVDAVMEHPTLVPSPEYPVARQRVHKNLEEYSFAWVLDPAPMQNLDPSAYERLSEIHVPTLLILDAEDDPVLFKHADKIQHDIAGIRRVLIPRTHHMPNMEKPEEFNNIVLDFLDKL